MMASAIGRPSVPARTADGGVPPTATQIGRSLPRARIDAWSCSGARCAPDQVTRSLSRIFSSSSSFSANSSS